MKRPVSEQSAGTALEIDDLDVHYGRVHALQGLSVRVGEGEIVSLLGNNGAGKTTTLASVSGVVPASGGRIRAFGEDITRAKPWEIVERGIIHRSEERRVGEEGRSGWSPYH